MKKNALISLNQDDVVVAVDPGGSTGICVGKVNLEARLRFDVLESIVLPWEGVLVGTLATLRVHRPKVVIVEEYTLRQDKANDQVGSHFPSVEVLGMIRAWCHLLKLAPPLLQQPVIMGRVEIPEEHRPLLLKGPSREHAKDSYKHLRYFIVRQRYLALR